MSSQRIQSAVVDPTLTRNKRSRSAPPRAGELFWTIWRTRFPETFRSKFHIRSPAGERTLMAWGRCATPQVPRRSRCSTEPNGLKSTRESAHGGRSGDGCGRIRLSLHDRDRRHDLRGPVRPDNDPSANARRSVDQVGQLCDAHLGSTGIYDDVRLDPAATVDIIWSPDADRLAYFERRYGCHSRGLGADISASSARRKPNAFAITGGDILAGDEYRCAGFGGKCNCCPWRETGGRLCRCGDRDTDRRRNVVPVRIRALV